MQAYVAAPRSASGTYSLYVASNCNALETDDKLGAFVFTLDVAHRCCRSCLGASLSDCLARCIILD